MYAGTLGRKHNSLLLVDLLRTAIEQGVPASLVVVSEGESADELAAVGEMDPAMPLRVVPFEPPTPCRTCWGQPMSCWPSSSLKPLSFSIPSKELSYMAAGRPILGLMPEGNPASADILMAGGHAAPPDSEGVKSSVAWLADLDTDRGKVMSIGRRSREIAEMKFDVIKVAQRFDEIITRSKRGPA